MSYRHRTASVIMHDEKLHFARKINNCWLTVIKTQSVPTQAPLIFFYFSYMTWKLIANRGQCSVPVTHISHISSPHYLSPLLLAKLSKPHP